MKINTLKQWFGFLHDMVPEGDNDVAEWYENRRGYPPAKGGKPNAHLRDAICRKEAVYYIKATGFGHSATSGRVIDFYGGPSGQLGPETTWPYTGKRSNEVFSVNTNPDLSIEVVDYRPRKFRGEQVYNARGVSTLTAFADFSVVFDNYWFTPADADTLLQHSSAIFLGFRLFQGVAGAFLHEDGAPGGAWFRTGFADNGLINFKPDMDSSAYPAHPDLNHWYESKHRVLPSGLEVDVVFLRKVGHYTILRIARTAAGALDTNVEQVNPGTRTCIARKQMEGAYFYEGVLGDLQRQVRKIDEWFVPGLSRGPILIHVKAASSISSLKARPIKGMLHDTAIRAVEAYLGHDVEWQTLNAFFPMIGLDVVVQNTARALIFDGRESLAHELLADRAADTTHDVIAQFRRADRVEASGNIVRDTVLTVGSMVLAVGVYAYAVRVLKPVKIWHGPHLGPPPHFERFEGRWSEPSAGPAKVFAGLMAIGTLGFTGFFQGGSRLIASLGSPVRS